MNYKFDELKYDPTDYEALKKEIVELTDKAEKASSSTELDDVLRTYDAALEDVGYNYTLSYIHASLDSSSSFWQGIAGGSIPRRIITPLYFPPSSH